MFPTRRRKNLAVIDRLLAEPHNYRFFQAVRLLERSIILGSQQDRGRGLVSPYASVGRFAPPQSETIRFKTKPSLAFPESELGLVSLDPSDAGRAPSLVQANVMGLAGSVGVLPFHYTEMILQRLKVKDDALAKFLDLFNHRTLSLFYQAGIKYSLPLEPERRQLANPRTQQPIYPTDVIRGLIGMETSGLQNRLKVRDQSLLFYAGLLSNKVRSATGLRQILADYFNLPVRIQEFVGQWQDLIPDVRTRLGSKAEPLGQNAQLACSAMLGSRGWIAQGKIRILLGPLSNEQFYRFAPGTSALDAMNELVTFYVGLEQDYEFILEVNRNDLPNKIQLNAKRSPILSWNTWLSSDTRAAGNGNNKLLRIRVSAKRTI